jgi:hypothetical protein
LAGAIHTLAGAIHTLAGSIHTLVHTFWQGNGTSGEVLTDFAIPTQDFAIRFLRLRPRPALSTQPLSNELLTVLCAYFYLPNCFSGAQLLVLTMLYFTGNSH